MCINMHTYNIYTCAYMCTYTYTYMHKTLPEWLQRTEFFFNLKKIA